MSSKLLKIEDKHAEDSLSAGFPPMLLQAKADMAKEIEAYKAKIAKLELLLRVERRVKANLEEDFEHALAQLRSR